MLEYRLFFLTPDGHILRRVEFESPNDEKALAHAKQFVDGKAIELWSGDRRIARIDPRDVHGVQFSSTEFLRADGPSRCKNCRELAAEAEALAASAKTADIRAIYLDLSRQWYALAEEMERATRSVPIENPSTGETAN